MKAKTRATRINKEDPRRRNLSLSVLGAAVVLLCLVFIAAFVFFQPDKLSLSDKYFPSPIATLTPTRTITPTPNSAQALAMDTISHWPVLYSDTFDSNKNTWPTGTNVDEYGKDVREIKDGKYNWQVSSKNGPVWKGWRWRVSADTKAVSDFQLTADIKRVSGSSQFDYGLVFRDDADDNYYYFGIDDEGFSVHLIYGNQYNYTLIEFTESSAILPEESNRLTVIAEGPHFLFFINDQLVGEMTDESIEKGITAVAVDLYYADLQATFEIDNFELREPKAGAIPPSPSQTATQIAWVKPLESPSLETAEEARQAIEAGNIKDLDDFILEYSDHSDIHQPGDVVVSKYGLIKSEPITWSHWWCATTREILEDNLRHMELTFTINEVQVRPEYLYSFIESVLNDDYICEKYIVLLNSWPTGEHHLNVQITFAEQTNNGVDTYPPGTYTFKYFVTVQP